MDFTLNNLIATFVAIDVFQLVSETNQPSHTEPMFL
jgi:hypothetical protein